MKQQKTKKTQHSVPAFPQGKEQKRGGEIKKALLPAASPEFTGQSAAAAALKETLLPVKKFTIPQDFY